MKVKFNATTVSPIITPFLFLLYVIIRCKLRKGPSIPVDRTENKTGTRTGYEESDNGGLFPIGHESCRRSTSRSRQLFDQTATISCSLRGVMSITHEWKEYNWLR